VCGVGDCDAFAAGSGTPSGCFVSISEGAKLDGLVAGEEGGCEGFQLVLGDEFGTGGLWAGCADAGEWAVVDHGGEVVCPAVGTEGVFAGHLEHCGAGVVIVADGTCYCCIVVA